MPHRFVLYGLLAVLFATPSLAQQKPPATSPTTPTKPSATAPATSGSSTKFDTDTAAKAHCSTDTVVWVNTASSIYHFAGTSDYGHTKAGTYMCEKDATAAGNRAAKNEKHP
jgi:hypothetical protein